MDLQSKTAGKEDVSSEVRRLRAELDDLKSRLAEIRSVSDVENAQRDTNPWLKIAATVGVTFALGKLIQALRLPTATAVAIPMISNEVNRRFL
ncbi:hypothetical protein [Rhizobium sp.]|uniref:hypothetical protein n=1 Tax=Rhizobium sp. TaxID=391 RepID=UPI00289B3028